MVSNPVPCHISMIILWTRSLSQGWIAGGHGKPIGYTVATNLFTRDSRSQSSVD